MRTEAPFYKPFILTYYPCHFAPVQNPSVRTVLCEGKVRISLLRQICLPPPLSLSFPLSLYPLPIFFNHLNAIASILL